MPLLNAAFCIFGGNTIKRTLPINERVSDYTIRIKEKTGVWGSFTGQFLYTKGHYKYSVIEHFIDKIRDGNFVIIRPSNKFALFRRYVLWNGEYKPVRDSKTGRKYKAKDVIHSDWEKVCELN